MWAIFLLAVYSLLIYFELPPLYKNKQWMDLGVNAGLTVISFVLLVLLFSRVRIPSPAVPIREFIISIIGR